MHWKGSIVIDRAWLRGATSLGVAVLMTAAGCGDAGPERFEISGNVSFSGSPVPYGEITFQPDNAKDNHGPGATAIIQDGRYQLPQDNGVIGGPHVIQITGFDGPPPSGAVPAEGETDPTRLFEQYTTEVDLPSEPATHDFDIPSESK